MRATLSIGSWWASEIKKKKNKKKTKKTRRDGAPLLKDTDIIIYIMDILQVSLFPFPPTFLGMAYDCRLKWGETNKTSDMYTSLKRFPFITFRLDLSWFPRLFPLSAMNVTIEEETYLVTDQSLSRIQNKTTKQYNIDQNRCGCHLNGVARRRHQRHYPHAPQRRQCESHGKQTRGKKKQKNKKKLESK